MRFYSSHLSNPAFRGGILSIGLTLCLMLSFGSEAAKEGGNAPSPVEVSLEADAAIPLDSITSEPQAIVVVTIWEAGPRNPQLPVYYQQELRQAIEDLGMSIRFVTLADATSSSFPGRIVVLRMKEDAREARRQLPSMTARSLAWTHASSSGVTPFGTVDLAALAKFVSLGPQDLAREYGASLFGRALGRVAAHEMFHMITRTMEHSDRGLMQSALSPQELTSERRPEWVPRHRAMAQSAFPQAALGGVLAAVQGTSSKRR